MSRRWFITYNIDVDSLVVSLEKAEIRSREVAASREADSEPGIPVVDAILHLEKHIFLGPVHHPREPRLLSRIQSHLMHLVRRDVFRGEEERRRLKERKIVRNKRHHHHHCQKRSTSCWTLNYSWTQWELKHIEWGRLSWRFNNEELFPRWEFHFVAPFLLLLFFCISWSRSTKQLKEIIIRVHHPTMERNEFRLRTPRNFLLTRGLSGWNVAHITRRNFSH